ncbi:hypothetical protein MHYP_G00260760 [Metynnis hypsauchen]
MGLWERPLRWDGGGWDEGRCGSSQGRVQVEPIQSECSGRRAHSSTVTYINCSPTGGFTGFESTRVNQTFRIKLSHHY